MTTTAPLSPAALIERFRSARHDESLAVLEGMHALKHAVRFGARLTDVVVHASNSAVGLAERLAPDLLPTLEQAAGLPEEVFGQLAPQAHPTGVMAIARRPRCSTDNALAPAAAPAILIENAVHLGNLGACIRVAAAAGARGVVTTGVHDPWAPESIRAAAGLQFALPVARLAAAAPLPHPLVALSPDGDDLAGFELPDGAVLAFGSERQGLSDALLARADLRVAIPMQAGVSSLNLATAVAVMLYAWRLGSGGRP